MHWRVALILVLAWPTDAAAVSYVAMGDSYSSGVGTREYYEDSGSCKRGPRAYPKLVHARLHRTIEFVACAGAETSDVWNTQLGALTRDTRWVTISIGGNDAGFSSVLYECAKPWWASNCERAVSRARRFIRESLPDRLAAVYHAIDVRVPPSATRIAVGYPRVFGGEDCDAGAWFDPDDIAMLNGTADLFARVERRVARGSGFAFVDPRRAFAGHAVCDDAEWINGLSSPLGESYHPNVAGNRAYARLVMRKIR